LYKELFIQLDKSIQDHVQYLDPSLERS